MRKFKKALQVLCALVLVFAMTFLNSNTAYATATTTTTEKPESEMTEEEKKAKEEKEKREKEIQAAYDLPVQSNEWSGWPKGPGTYDEAAIVMDADTGAVLYAKNIDKAEYPASITKVLTALLAFEYEIPGDTQVTITADALACLGSGYASIGLKEGNIINFEQAMNAMLLASANEAAYTVGDATGIYEGQDYNWFIQRMNERVEELGGVNSNFVNTNGVFDANHYTCAYDMALIGKALFAYPHFFEIAQTQQYTIEKTETVEEHIFQQKHHMLLTDNTDYYEYAVGGKTGYTTEAENTLITMADNGSRRLVAVVLKSYSGHPYEDTRNMLEYGFNNFTNVYIKDYLKSVTYDLVDETACVTLPAGVSFEDLDKKTEKTAGSEYGTLSYYYNDQLVGSAQIEYPSITKDVVENVVVPKTSTPEKAKQIPLVAYQALGAILFVAAFLICSVIALIVGRIAKRRKSRKNP